MSKRYGTRGKGTKSKQTKTERDIDVANLKKDQSDGRAEEKGQEKAVHRTANQTQSHGTLANKEPSDSRLSKKRKEEQDTDVMETLKNVFGERRSKRKIIPSSRFVNSDFVSPLTKRGKQQHNANNSGAKSSKDTKQCDQKDRKNRPHTSSAKPADNVNISFKQGKPKGRRLKCNKEDESGVDGHFSEGGFLNQTLIVNVKKEQTDTYTEQVLSEVCPTALGSEDPFENEACVKEEANENQNVSDDADDVQRNIAQESLQVRETDKPNEGRKRDSPKALDEKLPGGKKRRSEIKTETASGDETTGNNSSNELPAAKIKHKRGRRKKHEYEHEAKKRSELLDGVNMADIGDGKRKCLHCGKEVLERFAMSHLTNRCLQSPYRTRLLYPCTKCCSKFSSYLILNSHLKQHARKAAALEADPCQECGTVDCQSASICDDAEFKVSRKEGQGSKLACISKLVCEVCGIVMEDPESYVEHKKTHLENEFSWQCEYCAKKYRTKRDLTYHLRTKHLSGFKYNCVTCGLGLRCDNELKSHTCPKRNPVNTARISARNRLELMRKRRNRDEPQTVVIFEEEETRFIKHDEKSGAQVFKAVDLEDGKVGESSKEKNGCLAEGENTTNGDEKDGIASLVTKLAEKDLDADPGLVVTESVTEDTADIAASELEDEQLPSTSTDGNTTTTSSSAKDVSHSSSGSSTSSPDDDLSHSQNESGDDDKEYKSQESALATLADVAAKHQYACEFCGKGFASASGRHKHLKTVHGYKRTKVVHAPQSCCFCGRVFNYIYHLKEHIRAVHTDDKQFECDVCHKRYKSLKDRNYHKQTVHLGQYRYYCSHCNKGLHSAARFATHVCNWGSKQKQKKALQKMQDLTRPKRKERAPRDHPTLCSKWSSRQKSKTATKSKSSLGMKIQVGQSQLLVEDGSTAYLMAYWDDKGELIVEQPREEESQTQEEKDI